MQAARLLMVGALSLVRSQVTIHVSVGDGVRAKMLEVDIRRSRLRVARKGGDTILEGQLQQPIICDDSSWMMDAGMLVLVLAKVLQIAPSARSAASHIRSASDRPCSRARTGQQASGERCRSQL